MDSKEQLDPKRVHVLLKNRPKQIEDRAFTEVFSNLVKKEPSSLLQLIKS